MAELLFLKPVFKQTVWGGNRMRKDFAYELPGENTGECWGVSAHPDGDCRIQSGTFRGKKLSELWREERQLFGNLDMEEFPILVKIIDAQDKLSIQVHPGNDYARENENGAKGKEECWYILDCPQEAALVIGHQARSKEQLKCLIEAGEWEKLIRRVPIKRGDFIQINAGTMHAITAHVMLLETQQSSNLTYRIYDYGRKGRGKARKLHIEKGLEVMNVPETPIEGSIVHTQDFPENRLNQMISTEHYQVWEVKVSGEFTFTRNVPFLIMTVVSGRGFLNGVFIRKGRHFILPWGFGRVKMCGAMQIIVSTV